MDFKSLEKKWQQRWKQAKVFTASAAGKKKWFNLEMFPYPSSTGLHMGHAFNYVLGDIYARFKRMHGFSVLYPMGYDAFGLPAENAAIKANSHPKPYTEQAIKNFIVQQQALGLSYDWERIITTCDPDYYRWNQLLFLHFFKKGLVYKKKASVNWCSQCTTVLANEQVHGGACWRHQETLVEIKQLEQWFIKTTVYADELLDTIDDLDWPERIKQMQKNWIGKSEGAEIVFDVATESNFVLLHGYTGSAEKNFFPWLKKELERSGHAVFAPNLPNTSNPNISEQVGYVLKNYTFDEHTVLLGHSLGSVVALKIVEQLKNPIKKLVLAAGFAQPKFKDKERPFETTFDWQFDFNNIKKNVKHIVILRDIKDSAVPAEKADYLKEKIGGEIIDFVAERSHICGEQEPEVLNTCLERWHVFTTRPDTLFGVTFLVVAAQHPELMSLVTPQQKNAVNSFLKKLNTTKQEDLDKMEKEGVFIGSYAIHPLTEEKIPIYTGNFVVVDYGSGIVMAVPAHDQRDFEFAKKYSIPIKIVIQPKEKKLDVNYLQEAYTHEGILVNSRQFNDLPTAAAKEKIVHFLTQQKKGKKTTQYKLRDWLVSRQRYWGTPIPFIHCSHCGLVPVPEKDLPVLLPENVTFGKGNPLETNKEFVHTHCPTCKKPAKRETDTMDTFFDSSWYFLRFTDPTNGKQPFEKKKADSWMPVDFYVGGAEHACGHLIYARFFTKVLRDLGLVTCDEPFKKLFNQGMLHGEDGHVMSKSRGNVINPLEVIEQYGADTLRMFLVSVASADKDMIWSTEGIVSVHKVLQKLITLFATMTITTSSKRLESKLHQTIKEVTQYTEAIKYNLAVISLRTFIDDLGKEKTIAKHDAAAFLKLLHPFCPHITEELWEKLKNKQVITLESWPVHQEKKINQKIDAAEKFIQATTADIANILNLIKIKPQTITLFIAESWKYPLFKKLHTEKTRDFSALMKKFADKEKGQDIAKIVQQFMKGALKTDIVISLEEEADALKEQKLLLEKQFGAKIEIIHAETSKEQKAKQAIPGKVAIMVS
ncbi:MAG: alpha/beta fold hydrolase [Nanoarchaeota archaeon]